MTKVLITGAGTGFGKEVALRLAAEDFDVIAGVEIVAQIAALEEEAQKRGFSLDIQKLDVTQAADRERAKNWDIDILINNAGISEGGSTVDVPEEHLRRQFEVNVLGPVLLTQYVARNMVKRKQGKIIFISSVAGLTTDPFTGPYSASKHAVEAFAAALNVELKEFGIDVATVNPGPFLTGFNDRMFETWKYWQDNPKERIFDYSKLAFPHKQMDPEPAFQTIVDVALGKITTYRNLVPIEDKEKTRKQMDDVWDKEQNNGDTTRDKLVQAAYDLEPATPGKDKK